MGLLCRNSAGEVDFIRVEDFDTYDVAAQHFFGTGFVPNKKPLLLLQEEVQVAFRASYFGLVMISDEDLLCKQIVICLKQISRIHGRRLSVCVFQHVLEDRLFVPKGTINTNEAYSAVTKWVRSHDDSILVKVVKSGVASSTVDRYRFWKILLSP